MRLWSTFIFIFFFKIAFSQPSALTESRKAQEELNAVYLDPETSILEPEDFKDFRGLEFYPVRKKFIVKAKFIRTPNEKPFLMPTSTKRLPEYVKYAEAHFNLDNRPFVLNIYKSMSSFDDEKYKDNLFLPFTDLTNGNGSYGGGRYLSLRIPESDTIIIDFNKAYNPYCAYSARYSCPIPPEENDLQIKIEAGVKDFRRP